jgi:hypothetical protein
MLMGVAHHPLHARQRADLLWGSLGIATGDQDAAVRVFPVNAPYRGPGVLIGRGSYGTGIHDYELRLGGAVRAVEAAGL